MNLSGRGSSICYRRPFCRLKAPLGLSLLRCASQTRSMRFERSGRGQEPSRGHKFSISENFLSIRDFTSSMRLHFRSDLVGACLPQTLLRADEEELCQFDTIPPTIEKTERSRRGTLCFTYCYCLWLLAGCVLFRGAPCFCFEKKLEK